MHNETMIYGYARVSTAAQDESGQVRQLKATGCERVFRDKITGTTVDRPQLAKLMKRLTPGDVVITPAVDRLSRRADARPTASNSAERRSSCRTSSKRPASASTQARRNVASPAATTSVRVRFRG